LIDKLEQEMKSSGDTLSKNLTPNVHLSVPKKFIGLEKAMSRIRELMENSSIPILIHGFGGVGKTTLAQIFFECYHDDDGYYAWLNFYEDIPKTLIERSQDLVSSYFKDEKFKKENTREQFGKIIKTWKGLKGKKLLIIDGVEKALDDPDIQLLSILCRNYNWHILITSRIREVHFEVFSLEPPDMETAKALYFLHREELDPEESTESVEALLKFLGNHPLMIERSANLIKSSFITTPASLVETFEKQGLMGLAGSTDRVGSANTGKAAEEYLGIVFNLDNLDAQQVSLLTQVAAIAIIPLTFEMIAFALDKNSPEEKVKLDTQLRELVEHGWLARKENKVVMHQIIRQVAFYQARDNSCQVLLKTLGTGIYEEFDKDYSKWYDFQSYRPLLEELNKRVSADSIPYSDLLYNLAYLSSVLDVELDQAVDYANHCIAVIQRNQPVDQLRLALAYNNLSLIMHNRKKMEEAFSFQEIAFNIRKNSGQPYPYAESMLNLGLLYSDESERKNMDKAIDLINQAVKIEEELYPEGHPHLSNCYENLSWVYELNEEIRKAVKYQRKALEINEKIFPQHPYLVDSYGSLANLLFKYGKNEAIDYWLKALEAGERIFRKDSEQLANLFFDFSEFLMLASESDLYMDQYHNFQVNALNALQEARLILENIYLRTELVHIYLQMAQIFYNLRELENAEAFIQEAGELIWEAEQNEIEFHASWKEFYHELETRISFDQGIAQEWYCDQDLAKLFRSLPSEKDLAGKILNFTLVEPEKKATAGQDFYRFFYGELSKVSVLPEEPELVEVFYLGNWISHENLDSIFIQFFQGALFELKKLKLNDQLMEWEIKKVSREEEE